MSRGALPSVGLTILALGLVAPVFAQSPTSTAITYQGQLTDRGVPFTGSADFRVAIHDAATGGTALETLTVRGVTVNVGLFTLTLGFDPAVFNGDGRWLELAVSAPPGDPYVTLTPRQALLPAPYALYALNSEAALTLPYYGTCPLDVGDALTVVQPGDGAAAIVAHSTGEDGRAVHASASMRNSVALEAQADGAALHAIIGSATGTGTLINYGGKFTAWGDRGYGVYGHATAPTGTNYGVYGRSDSTGGRGVHGYNSATSGTATGVRGRTASPDGYGVWGVNNAVTGSAIGVYGTTSSPTGFGGWFDGQGYFSGHVGIGTAPSDSSLTVAGLIESASGGFKFPDGTTQTTAATGGGDSFWEAAPSGIRYNDGYVGMGQTSNPAYPLHVAESSESPVVAVNNSANSGGGHGIFAETGATTGSAVVGRNNSTTGSNHGLYGIAFSPDGHAVRGHNTALTGDAIGVSGQSASVDGTGMYGYASALTGTTRGVHGKARSPDGFGGYFEGHGYFSGNVGIGTTDPSSKLDVDGTVRMTGIRLGSSATAGHVLTADALGNGTWQPAAGGYWSGGTGGKIYYNDGNVGIGTTNPAYHLHVQTDQSHAGYFNSCADTGDAFGVYGRAEGPAGGSPGTTHYGLFGSALNAHSNVGVYGVAGNGSYNWGGYFEGMLYASGNAGIGNPLPNAKLHVVQTMAADAFRVDDQSDDATPFVIDQAGNVGIGTPSPGMKLHVVGSIKTNGIQVASGPQAGYVLTSDASGNGTWQPAFALPYSGAISSTGTAFSVTNSGGGVGSHAISATIDNASGSGDAAAGEFRAVYHGHAIIASNSSGATIYATNDGVGSVITAKIDGANSPAVVAEAKGAGGTGVHAKASGGGPAITAEATGSSLIGIECYGNVILYESGTTTPVLELGKGLDYAEGFDFSEGDRETLEPGSVVIIDSDNPGHLTRSVRAYDRRVAGIVAGAEGLGSGVRLGAGQFDHDVALAGRVYCNVAALDQDIQPGDLLTTSDIPGYAMKVTDFTRSPGAVLGKAMEPLAKGQRGRILVLVTLQ